MQQHLFNHFCTSECNSFSEDVWLIFIDKTDSYDQRGYYFRYAHKKLVPFGFNIMTN